jgi:hypothetical protein
MPSPEHRATVDVGALAEEVAALRGSFNLLVDEVHRLVSEVAGARSDASDAATRAQRALLQVGELGERFASVGGAVGVAAVAPGADVPARAVDVGAAAGEPGRGE